MTVILLRTLGTALGVTGAEFTNGQVACIPWAGNSPVTLVDGQDVTFPTHVSVRVVDGVATPTLDLAPSGATWCWRIVVSAGQRRLTRYVVVPPAGPVEFDDLVQVDPYTFVPSPDVVAGWDAAYASSFASVRVDENGDLIGTTHGGAEENAGHVAGGTGPAGGGVRWVAFGDSLTSLAGGGAPYMGWTVQAEILSQGRVSVLANAGVPGDNASHGIARVDDVLAYDPTLVTVWFGTNDISQGRTLTAYQADMTAIVDRLVGAGATVCLFTIPPRGDASKIAQTNVWNQWLRDLARDKSVHLIDAYDALVNRATGTFATGFDYGDGIHLTQLGHRAVASLFSEVMLPRCVMSEPLTPRTNVDPNNLLANGLLLAGMGASPDSWIVTGGPAAGFTETWVNDADFAGGKAWQVAAVTPGSFRQFVQNVSDGWSIGDVLLFTARIKVVSSSGVPEAEGIGLNVNCNFFGAASPVNPAASGVRLAGLNGLVSKRLTVPAGTTLVQLDNVFNPTAAGTATWRVGDLGIFNLTRMGLV